MFWGRERVGPKKEIQKSKSSLPQNLYVSCSCFVFIRISKPPVKPPKKHSHENRKYRWAIIPSTFVELRMKSRLTPVFFCGYACLGFVGIVYPSFSNQNSWRNGRLSFFMLIENRRKLFRCLVNQNFLM